MDSIFGSTYLSFFSGRILFYLLSPREEKDGGASSNVCSEGSFILFSSSFFAHALLSLCLSVSLFISLSLFVHLSHSRHSLLSYFAVSLVLSTSQ